MRTRRIPHITIRLAVIMLLTLLPWITMAATAAPPDEELIGAAKIGNLERIKALLDKGANVSAKDEEGSTPLMAAAREGHLAVVNLLLDRGADVNTKDNNGFTALMWAATKGHLPVAKQLLEKGADVRSKDNLGLTALKRA